MTEDGGPNPQGQRTKEKISQIPEAPRPALTGSQESEGDQIPTSKSQPPTASSQRPYQQPASRCRQADESDHHRAGWLSVPRAIYNHQPKNVLARLIRAGIKAPQQAINH